MRLKVCRNKHINNGKQEGQQGKHANTDGVDINSSQGWDFCLLRLMITQHQAAHLHLDGVNLLFIS